MLERSNTLLVACFAGMLGAGMVLLGCGPVNVPKPRVIPVAADPLGEVQSLFEGYATGLPVGSERETFGRLVEAVRGENPDIADWLGNALAEIDANPGRAQSLAKKAVARFAQRQKHDQ